MPQFTNGYNLDWFAHESITVDNTVGGKSLTAATYAVSGHTKAQVALVTVEDASLRYTIDGTTPTSAVGHLATSGAVITLASANEILRFRAIRSGASSSTIKVSYAR